MAFCLLLSKRPGMIESNTIALDEPLEEQVTVEALSILSQYVNNLDNSETETFYCEDAKGIILF